MPVVVSSRPIYLQIDEDGNGYIMIGELHALADSLGLPIAPEEQDEALEAVSYVTTHRHAMYRSRNIMHITGHRCLFSRSCRIPRQKADNTLERHLS